jgi:hypothetical protein
VTISICHEKKLKKQHDNHALLVQVFLFSGTLCVGIEKPPHAEPQLTTGQTALGPRHCARISIINLIESPLAKRCRAVLRSCCRSQAKIGFVVVVVIVGVDDLPWCLPGNID